MNNLSKRILTSLILLLTIYFSLLNFILFSICLICLNFFILIEFNFLYRKIFKYKNLYYFFSFLITFIYIIFFSSIIWKYLFSNFETSINLIIFLITICSSTDIGGFLFGKLIGGKKLTKVSPNKTYAGVIGSFILPLLLGLLYLDIYNDRVIEDVNNILLIIVISFFSQLGDLIISFFKRKAKVKDTGRILPGHGGILDRADGILLAVPIAILIIYMY